MPAENTARHYKELLVWQKETLLPTADYKLTARFPTEERYGLASQRRRAAISIQSDIAEVRSRQRTREFL